MEVLVEMKYSQENQKAIEEVQLLLAGYLQNNSRLDVVYSKTFGFLALSAGREDGGRPVEAVVAADGVDLLLWVFRQLCRDVAGAEAPGLGARREVRRRLLELLGPDCGTEGAILQLLDTFFAEETALVGENGGLSKDSDDNSRKET